MFHDSFTAFLFDRALFRFNLAYLDIVDSFVDPLIPVHSILSIELHTTQLHFELLIVGHRVARE